MIFRDLYATFAGLNDRKLQLSHGLNIIEGTNESGKSTWCAFIRAMLYGVDTSERDRVGYIAEKNRFRPWSGALMSGVMKMDTPQGELTIERRSTAAAPLKTVRLLDASGGDVPMSAVDVGERLTGVSREVLERSAFISIPALTGGSGELEKRVLATVSDGDDGAGYAKASATLKDWKNRLKVNSNGLMPKKEAELNMLRHKLSEVLDDERVVAHSEAQLAELHRDKARFEAELAVHNAADRARAAEQVTKAREALETARLQRVAVQDELPVGTPSVEQLRDIQRVVDVELARRTEHERAAEQRNALSRQRAELEQQLEHFPDIYGSSEANTLLHTASRLVGVGKAAVMSIAAALVFATGFVALFVMKLEIYSYLSAAISFILFAFAAVSISSRRSNLHAICRRLDVDGYTDIAPKLERYRSLARLIEQFKLPDEPTAERRDLEFTVVAAKLQTLFGYNNLEQAAELLPRVIAAAEQYERALAHEKSAEKMLQSLSDAVAIVVDIIIASPTMTRAQAEAQLQTTEQRIAHIATMAARAEGRLGDDDSAAIAAEIERAQQTLDEYAQRYAAIETAQQLLSGASAKLRERFSPALTRETSELFSRLTCGRYDRASISRDFIPEAGCDDSGGLRSLIELSAGTADQLWLALRLAICRTVLPPNLTEFGAMPLILDDALLTFDDARLSAALELLLDEAQSRQVLLFTCQGRERLALTGSQNVNYVNALC